MSVDPLAVYAAHQAAVAQHDGGESADWPEIASALADDLAATLRRFPLEAPLAAAFPTAVRAYGGAFPVLMVVHDGEVPDPGQSDSGYERSRHRVHLAVICGPAGGDPGRMLGLGAAYFTALKVAVDAMQSLGGRVKGIRRSATAGLTWSVVDGRWFGVTLPVEVAVQRRRVWGA